MVFSPSLSNNVWRHLAWRSRVFETCEVDRMKDILYVSIVLTPFIPTSWGYRTSTSGNGAGSLDSQKSSCMPVLSQSCYCQQKSGLQRAGLRSGSLCGPQISVPLFGPCSLWQELLMLRLPENTWVLHDASASWTYGSIVSLVLVHVYCQEHRPLKVYHWTSQMSLS